MSGICKANLSYWWGLYLTSVSVISLTLQLSLVPLHPGCWLIFIKQPLLLDPTSSTSRTQTFVGLISSAGALSYFVSEAVGMCQEMEMLCSFLSCFLSLFSSAQHCIWIHSALLLTATEISLNMSSFGICTNNIAKA